MKEEETKYIMSESGLSDYFMRSMLFSRFKGGTDNQTVEILTRCLLCGERFNGATALTDARHLYWSHRPSWVKAMLLRPTSASKCCENHQKHLCPLYTSVFVKEEVEFVIELSHLINSSCDMDSVSEAFKKLFSDKLKKAGGICACDAATAEIERTTLLSYPHVKRGGNI